MTADFLNVFARSPGDLLFLLGVILITQAGLFMALERRLHAPYDRAAERYLLAGVGMTGVWALLMIGALVALVSGQSAAMILPPLERAAQVVTILLVGWAFITADSTPGGRSTNLILLALLGVVCLGYIVTGLLWPEQIQNTDFNQSQFGLAWALISVVVCVLGLALVLYYFRVVTDAPLKMVYFALLLVGYAISLIEILQGTSLGQYSGLARLTFLAALPVLPMVIYRMIITHLQTEIDHTVSQVLPPALPAGEPPPPVQPEPASRERESAQLLRALGIILETTDTDEIPQRVVVAALEVLRADVGMILRVQDANYADILYAYDRVQERAIMALSVNLENQPTLSNAIDRRTQRPLFVDRNEAELSDLYMRLDITTMGPMYFQPLVYQNRLVAVLVVALPYAKREMDESERDRLKGFGVIASSLLALSFEAVEAQRRAEERTIEAMIKGVPLDSIGDTAVMSARQEMMANLELARDQITALNQQVGMLKLELDRERNRFAELLGDTEEELSITQRMVSLRHEQEHLRAERDSLLERLQQAETALAGATGTGDSAIYQTMIDVLQREKTDLLMQRENLHQQLADVRQGKLPDAMQDILLNMSNDRVRMEAERDQLRDKLNQLEAQLADLGIANDSEGLSRLVRQLNEQLADLQARHDQLKRERDLLAGERARIESGMEQQTEQARQFEALRSELKHVASDREVAVKQREQLRLEHNELLAALDKLKEVRARLLADVESYRQELEEAHEEQTRLRQERQALADEQSDLQSYIERLEAERAALLNERDQLYARVEGDRERLQQLGNDGVGSLTSIIEDLTTERNHLERGLNGAQTALAAAENRIEMLQMQLNARHIPPAASEEDRNLILGMLQELRTPLTSIVGYVDLLLSESAGILGEMQHKFLRRVEANINRLTAMLDEVTRIAVLDSGHLALIPRSIDMITLIEDAITRASGQFREKGLAIHLNLAEDLPWISADHDALSQVLDQLLINAYLASPASSDVHIRARRQRMSISREGGAQLVDSLLVSVEDHGGGIATEDQARVFSRKYRADNPLIAGLGDTGVGLALAKALVEAHGGTLWLESQAGVGTTFSFVVPVEPVLEAQS